jgi:hypothetical protein
MFTIANPKNTMFPVMNAENIQPFSRWIACGPTLSGVCRPP